jgi:hypothetical protein
LTIRLKLAKFSIVTSLQKYYLRIEVFKV